MEDNRNKSSLDIKKIKRVVVKVGSSTITHSTGLLNLYKIDKIASQLADLQNMGYEVVLVTSGAIGAGVGRLAMKERPKNMPEKQAAAAVGQSVLFHIYQKTFSEYGKITGQILLTKSDFSDRKRFINARNTFKALISMGVVPIVNENDAVVVDEIKVGENDSLSAHVSAMIEADLLILLSDIDGLYTADPRKDPDAQMIFEVEKVTDEIKALAGGAGSTHGTGGMATKLKAAEIATSYGCHMVIANGEEPDIIRRVVAGDRLGTVFMPGEQSISLRKHWIGFESKSKGSVRVDEGAEKALRRGKSLLPVGIVEVKGSFSKGDTLAIEDINGNIIGYGITYYKRMSLEKIMGARCFEIEIILGSNDYDEAIHADNMIIIN